MQPDIDKINDKTWYRHGDIDKEQGKKGCEEGGMGNTVRGECGTEFNGRLLGTNSQADVLI